MIMKKFVTILITLCMLVSMLPLAIHAETTVTNLLTAESLVHSVARDGGQTCTGTFNADGTMTASNGDVNDAVFLTDLYVAEGKHVYIEATAKFEGTAWGIMFTESGKDAPFEKWCCLNIDAGYNSRLFCQNCATSTNLPFEPQVPFADARDGQYHTLGLEILADGTMKVYLDNVMHTYLDKASFKGGTVGINTCRANVTFKSFTIQEGAPTHTTVRPAPRALEFSSTTNLLDENVLKHQTSDVRFTFADGKMAAEYAGGDRAIMSDIFVNPGDHVYIEATATITSGSAWGIMLSTASAERPFDGWFCLNVDHYKSRIFSPNSNCDVATPLDYFHFDENNGEGKEVTLALEITPDGTFYLTCNGVTYASNKATQWSGAYVGLMSWDAAVEFTSATFNVVKGLKVEEPDPTPDPAPTGDIVLIALAASAVAILPAVIILKKKERV